MINDFIRELHRAAGIKNCVKEPDQTAKRTNRSKIITRRENIQNRKETSVIYSVRLYKEQRER
jgi:hypothetical protein